MNINRIICKLGVIIIFFFASCDKSDDVKPEPPTFKCNTEVGYYFSGIVNDTLKCFIEGISNYQPESGTNAFSQPPVDVRYRIGMDTYPVNVGDESIVMGSPLIKIGDVEGIPLLFPKRKLTIDERSKFYISYRYVTEAQNGLPTSTYYYDGIFDNQSSLEVIEFEQSYVNSQLVFEVTVKFSCKLYDKSGVMKGEIISGELTGRITPRIE